MDFSLLPVFIAITEQGSLTKAAEYLHMTKSAVSKNWRRWRLKPASGWSPVPRAIYN